MCGFPRVLGNRITTHLNRVARHQFHDINCTTKRETSRCQVISEPTHSLPFPVCIVGEVGVGISIIITI